MGSGVPADMAVGGIDGSSALACVVGRLDPGLALLVEGGRYAWPMAGVKMGRVETVDSIFVKEVTVESCMRWSDPEPVQPRGGGRIPAGCRECYQSRAPCRHSPQPQNTN